MLRRLTATVAAALLFASVPAVAGTIITGAGATFPYPIYAKWASAYRAKTGTGLNYQSIGSGGGIKQIESKTVTFGASDAPLDGAELNKYGLVQFPMVMGGIVPVVHLSGVKPGQLVIDGKTLANIYMGKITKWNDPALKALNPGVNLPDKAIAVVHRSDGSGTTYNFSYYLSDVSPAWKSAVGTGKSVQWPVGLGSKGNEGVAAGVQQTDGAIGYVEYAYATQNKLTYTRMKNRDGKVVAPTAKAFAAAATGADWNSKPGYGVILANQPGAGTWPMTAATFILMYKKPVSVADSNHALKFFQWAYAHGDDMALKLDYIPMPDKVVGMVQGTWKQIQGWNGK